MVIGIDASRLIENGRTGTENYLYYLIKSLARIDIDNKYILYFRARPIMKYPDNFEVKILSSKISWTQVALAKESLNDTLDILFTPWHTLPILHRPSLKIVSTIHGLEYEALKGYPTLYTTYFSDAIIAVSKFTKDQLIKKFFVKKEKITVIHEGVDTQKFYKRNVQEIKRVKEKYNISTNYILFVGTINPRKNIRLLVKVYENILSEKNSESNQLVLAGKIPEKHSNLKTLIQDSQGKNIVNYIGRVEEEDLPALISGAKFLVFPSLTEGFGLPVLEAMACEAPILTSNTGALPEVAGNAAYFIDPKSFESLYTGIKRLISDRDLRQSLINLGKERVKSFSWDLAAQKTFEVFRKVYDRSK